MQDWMRKFVQKVKIFLLREEIKRLDKKVDRLSRKIEGENEAVDAMKEVLKFKSIKSLSEIPGLVGGTEEMVAKHLVVKVQGRKKDVVLLGENHLATENESRSSAKIIAYFECVGFEGIDVSEFIEGRVLFWFRENFLRKIFELVSLGKRAGKHESSATIAESLNWKYKRKVKVIELEKGWKPGFRARLFMWVMPLTTIYAFIVGVSLSIRVTGDATGGEFGSLVGVLVELGLFWVASKIPIFRRLAWLVFGFLLNVIFDLGPSRERIMVKNTWKALSDVKIGKMVITTGRGHTDALAKLFKEKHGAVDGSWEG